MAESEIVADRFRLGARVSEGGMAYIVRAEDLKTGRTVAVKLLKVGDAESLARFEREAAVLEALRHPQIVEHVAHGIHAGRPFLVLEWLEGCDLRTRMDDGPLGVAESVAIAESVARALAASHALGVVHRDLKPENVFLVGRDPRAAKLLDYGIARVEGSSRTRTGVMMGTPHYMAPEQARGEPTDARTDLWALGVVLFECLSGVQPFRGEHVPAILTKVAFEPAPALADLVPHAPEHLAELCAELLEKDPRRRPQSASLVLDRLSSAPPPSLRPSKRQALGRSERTTACVVLTGVPPATDDGTPRRLRTARLDGAEVMPVELDHGGYAFVLVRDGEAVDVAARAARQAITLREDLGAAVPIAVVTTRLASRAAVGGSIEEAARLLASATEGIVVDDATASLLEGRFDLVRDSHWVRLAEERTAAETSRLLLGKATPFVGRDNELAMLEGLYDESVDDRSSRVVVVTAGAGAGKSRLWRELARRLEGRAEAPLVWLARSDPERAGTPFSLLAALAREAIGCRESQPRAEQLCAVLEFCQSALGSSPRMERALTALLDLWELVGVDPRPGVEEICEAWIAASHAAAAGRPLVVGLEDMHWADRPSILALDRMVASERVQPLLLVALARPTELDSLADFLSRRNPLRINLPPLRSKAIESLARATLGDRLSRSSLDFIVSHAQGNAFVVEELIRAVSRGQATIPETALAVAEARLDTLTPEVRRAFRAASIFGETVWASAVGALVADPSVDRALETLVEQELLLPRATSRFAGETEFALRHALLREAGYATLSEEDRVRGHAAALSWLTVRGEKSAAALAQHAERGRRHEEAVAHFTRAAREALSAFDHVAARDLVARGLRCGAAGEGRASLLWIEADAYVLLQDPASTRRAAAQALACTAPASITWYGVVACLVAAAHRLSDTAEAERLFLAIDEMARQSLPPLAAPSLLRAARSLLIIDLVNESSALAELAAGVAAEVPAVLGPLHQLQALTALAEGRLDAALSHIRKAVAAHAQAGNVAAMVNAKQDTMLFLTRLGRYDEAEAVYRSAVAGEHQLGATGNSLLENLAYAHVSARKNLAEAAEMAERAVSYRVSLGDARYVVACCVLAARANVLLGEPQRAREELLARQLQAEEQPALLGLWLATLADAERLCGDPSVAAAHADAAEHELEARRPALELSEVFARSAIIDAFAAAGRMDDARRAAHRLGELLDLQANRIEDEGERRRFVEEIPDNVEARAKVARFA